MMIDTISSMNEFTVATVEPSLAREFSRHALVAGTFYNRRNSCQENRGKYNFHKTSFTNWTGGPSIAQQRVGE